MNYVLHELGSTWTRFYVNCDLNELVSTIKVLNLRRLYMDNSFEFVEGELQQNNMKNEK